MLFDVNVLDAERQRITDYLLCNGYYKFNKDYIGYTADTVRNTYNVDLTQHLQMYKAHAIDSARAHQQYWINKINFITDYDVLQSSALSSVDINDSVHYKDIRFTIRISSIYVLKCLRITSGLLPAICLMSVMCSKLIPVSGVCLH